MVDESALTLKLPAARLRRGPFASTPSDVAAVIFGALLVAAVGLATTPSPSTSSSGAVAEPVAVTAAAQADVAKPEEVVSDRGPVFASGLSLHPSMLAESIEEEVIIIFDDEIDDEEIIIFDDSEPSATVAPASASKRERERTAVPTRSLADARQHAKDGRQARDRGALPAATQHYRDALQAWPAYAPAAAALAELHMKHRQYRQALRYAKRAAQHAPRNAEYQLLLGDAYFLAKQRTAGRAAWRKAAALGSAKARSRL